MADAKGVKRPKSSSLRGRMRASQTALTVLMLIPALVAIVLMMRFSSEYHRVISHLEEISSLRPVITDELLMETMNIVVGRTRFEDGAQMDILKGAADKLDGIIEQNPSSRPELEFSRNVLGTMEGYMRSLGEQMGAGSKVEEDMSVYDEIFDVSTLFLDMLQEAVNTELLAAAAASGQMQQVIRTTLVVEICLLLLTLVFAAIAQRSLSRAIQAPLLRLKNFAGRIAGGELSERTERPEVEELRDLAESLNIMAFKLERLMAENIREQENLKKSEMRALQAQITPHFLYNTLDAIVWLAETRQSEEVIQVTQALSDFFRTSLSNGRDWISIEEEVRHLEGYLMIQRVRYRDILQYEIEIDETLGQQKILKLLIQPLVENALYHGIKERRGGGKVTVCARRNGGNLCVSVQDNGHGMTPGQLAQIREALQRSEPLDSESGYGLYSVDQRIKLHYGQPTGLVVESGERQGTTVRFTVPLKEAAHV